MDHLEQDLGKDHVVIDRNFYWQVSNVARYHFKTTPSDDPAFFTKEILVGSHADEWGVLSSSLDQSGDDSSATFSDFEYFGALMCLIADQLDRPAQENHA